MNHPSDAAAASLPAGGEPDPPAPAARRLRLLAWSAAGHRARGRMRRLCAYALVYPERMPPAVGAIVEDITGANPHPVHTDAPADRAAERGRAARQTDFLRPVAVGIGQAVVRVVPLAPSIRMGRRTTRSRCNSAAPHMTAGGLPAAAFARRICTGRRRSASARISGDTDVPRRLTHTGRRRPPACSARKRRRGVAPAAPAMVPQGGLFWDGRADTLQDQALGPLTQSGGNGQRERSGCRAQAAANATYLDQFKQTLRRIRSSNQSEPAGCRSDVRGGPLSDRRSVVPRVHQQVRLLARRQGALDAGRAARPAACSTIQTRRTARAAI